MDRRTLKSFDRKFGPAFLKSLPQLPGVYRFYESSGLLIYVGKAKNIRRRLSQYRNVKRLKKHRKMKSIVSQADRLEFELCPSEHEALCLETRLIQAHRPRWNVAGAFSFLYPMIGMKKDLSGTYFCYTTSPDLWQGFEFFGAFRSRDLTREAFRSLMELLRYVGHPISRGRLPKRPDRYSIIQGFRQIPNEYLDPLARFWKGESSEAIASLVLALVENAGARDKKRDVQGEFNHLKRFWKFEALPLKRAIQASGFATFPVPQKERDFIFLNLRYAYRAPATLHSPRKRAELK